MKKANGYWHNKALVLSEARKYKTIKEWTENSGGSRSAAKKLGWYKEATAHMQPSRKPKNFWSKDNAVKSAKKYETITEWRKKEGHAYGACRENGWLEEATSHMKRKAGMLWNYLSVKNISKKYSTPREWAKNSSGSYSWASKNGLIKELTSHMNRVAAPPNFWTKQKVLEDAKKHKSRTEWKKKSKAYSTAAANGWVDEATAHMPRLVEHGKWTKTNVIKSAEKYKHLIDWRTSNPGAYGKALKRGWLADATSHMVKPPSKKRIWTKEKVIEEARKYDTNIEFRKYGKGAVHAAIQNDWLREATAHMHAVYSFGELTIYKLFKSHDIDFIPQKRFEAIRDRYPLPYDFYLPKYELLVEYHGIQHFEDSYRTGRVDFADRKKKDKIKRIGAKFLGLELLVIAAKTEIQIRNELFDRLTTIAKRKGFTLELKERTLTKTESNKLKSLGKWTKEDVLADARKYKTFNEWRKNSPAHQIAWKNGWLEESKLHMISDFEVRSKIRLKWNQEECIKDARKYRSRSEWKTNNAPAYSSARRHGWLEQACKHMTRKIKPNGYWTKEKVFASARKYKSRIDWQRSEDSTAYSLALQNDWLNECCSHMRIHKSWARRLSYA